METNNTVDGAVMDRVLREMGERAKCASRKLAVLSSADKVRCLERMAERIEFNAAEIKKINAADLENAQKGGLSAALIDRLTLNDCRIREMAEGLRTVAGQTDPVGKILEKITRPNGLEILKISVPFGVIGIIYESRPNVTVDAAGICIKAGNAVILRGGSEAFHSNLFLAKLLNEAAMECGLPDGTVQLVPWTAHEAVNLMLKLDRYIDVVIPRGGERLIRVVCKEATMPVLKHYKGVCHIYLDELCDLAKAPDIIENAKCQRPSACNALETLLIHRKIAGAVVPDLVKRLKKRNVRRFGDPDYCKLDAGAQPAKESDFCNEYLDFAMNVKLVDSVEEAVEHVNRYGSHHSDAILTEDGAAAQYFYDNVDSATVYWNASTRFTDGGEFGKGAEIGISTDKLHARGPMGADELTSYKYLIKGNGQIRK